MKNKYSPIVLFVYNRIYHVKKVIDSIKNAIHGDNTPIIIVSDGYKNISDKEDVLEVRSFIRELDWKAGKQVIEKNENNGLGNIIPNTLNTLFKSHDTLIILEDDIEIGSEALMYFNNALKEFKGSSNVFSISGFMEPFEKNNLPDYFLSPHISCWGWATWADKWSAFEMDSKVILSKLYENEEKFNLLKQMPINLYKDLILNCDQTMNTWAVKWGTSVLLNNGLAFVPNKSFVRNIGHDNTGTNCSNTEIFETKNLKEYQELKPNEILFCEEGFEMLKEFHGFKSQKKPSNLIDKIPSELKKAIKFIFLKRYRKWSLIINSIKFIKRFEPYSFNWYNSEFSIIDKESFLQDYNIYYKNPLIKSFEFNSGGNMLDLCPREGTALKFFSTNFKQMNLFSLITNEKDNSFLRKNLISDNITYLNFQEIIEWSNSKNIDFIQLSNTNQNLKIFFDNLSNINSFLIHFSLLKSDYTSLVNVLNSLSNNFVINIESYGLEEEKFFRLRYRANTRFYLIGYRK